MKQTITLLLCVATITLISIVAFRLSVDALALIVGVLLGIIALVPTLVIGGLLMRKTWERRPEQQAHPTPPVIVVNGGQPYAQTQQLPPPSQPALMNSAPQTPRHFRLLGFEEEEEVDDGLFVWQPDGVGQH